MDSFSYGASKSYTDKKINYTSFQQMFIKNNRLTMNNDHINTDGRVAKYTFADIGDKCQKLMCRACFSTDGSIALVSNPNGRTTVDDITTGSIHIVFYQTYASIGLFISGTLVNISTINYTVVLDETTVYEFGFSIDESVNQITIYKPGGGTPWTVTDTRIPTANGRYVCWELTNTTVTPTNIPTDKFPHGYFTAFYANPITGRPLMDVFDRPDGPVVNARTGHVYTQCRNAVTADDYFNQQTL